MPATDVDFEREFAELVSQLRDVPAGAPDSLRTRVRTLGEPETPPTLHDRLATLRWRRAALVLAPACVAVLLSVAVVRGLLSSSASRPQAASTTESAGTGRTGAAKSPRQAPVAPTPAWGTSTTSDQLGLGHNGQHGVLAPGTGTGGRPVDYDASLRVRVRDAADLSDKTADAMRVARSLGGYVASLQQTTM